MWLNATSRARPRLGAQADATGCIVEGSPQSAIGGWCTQTRLGGEPGSRVVGRQAKEEVAGPRLGG